MKWNSIYEICPTGSDLLRSTLQKSNGIIEKFIETQCKHFCHLSQVTTGRSLHLPYSSSLHEWRELACSDLVAIMSSIIAAQML